MDHENRVPLLKNENILIVPIQGELDDLETAAFQKNLVKRVSEDEIKGVLIDISNLETIDLYLAREITHTAKMVALMDVATMIVGIKPHVAITLTEMGITFGDVPSAPTLETGLKIVNRKISSRV